MPRSIEVVVPSEHAEELVARAGGIEGVVGVARFQGASVSPAGDVVRVQVTNDRVPEFLRAIEELGVHRRGSFSSSQLNSLVTSSGQELLERESDEGVWEEVATLLRRETHLGYNFLLLMALSGMIAAVGLWQDRVHIVIAAMVVAPGFEPMVRAATGAVFGPRVSVRRGVYSTLAGYAALAAGAAAMCAVLVAVDESRSSDLQDREWVRFWTTLTGPTLLLSAAAAVAGGVVVTGQRPVLTAGVMIALVLIPGMAIAGMGVVVGDFGLAGRGLARWGEDVALVVVLSLVVVAVKQRFVHRRRALG